MNKTYWIYLMMNKMRTVIYTGVTNNLIRRPNVNKLVYFEDYNDINQAIACEKQIKGWSRAKK